MLHLHLVRHRIKLLVGLILVGLIGWATLSGFPASARGPARSAARQDGIQPKDGAPRASSTTMHGVNGKARNSVDDGSRVSINLGVNNYRQTNLVSDIPGVADILDTNLVNPWGLAFSATSPFWVSNEGTGTSTLYSGDVSGSTLSKVALTVTIPGGGNTGVVFNGSNDFTIPPPCGTPPCPLTPISPARFIFATTSGKIMGWSAGNTTAVQAASRPGHAYTGLAIGNNGTSNFLYAADFPDAKIDVYDKNFAPATLAGSFTDPGIPAGYAPFNIQNLGGKLYVTYALQSADKQDAVPGPGNGYMSVFDTNGNFLGRLVSNGPLNAPWGVTIAPAGFGVFGGSLLVGNFGDGRINAFNPTTGAFLGTLNDQAGNPIEIDELWAIAFGNGAGAGDTGTLYFTSGIGEEAHGIFGKLQSAAPATSLIQFSSNTYEVSEGSGLSITVTRAGDVSQPATVNYATYDERGPGNASQTSDYITAEGTLKFAAGEASKTFPLLITDDIYVEGDENIHLILSNPTGAALGSPNVAQVIIHDNDVPTFTVPIPRTFVATLTGSQEVPSKVTNGKGVGVVLLNDNEQTAKVSLVFTDLTSPAQAAHIHSPAPPGTNAPVLFPLINVPAATSGSVNNITINLTPQQVQDLKNGLMYFNVHTTNNPGGEIRGQILYNPDDEAIFFVRQQYRDFLNREADQGGLVYWFSQISDFCGANAQCISRRRIDVSAAFFLETEFRQTGFFVYRVRKASLGLQPTYEQYILDRNQLASGSDADKRAFIEAFVQRSEFMSVYPASMNGSDFIDKLIATIKASSGVDLTPRRPELVNEYLLEATQAASRARVIRKAIEYPEYINAEFNPAFVLAQYFSYLRRNPDPGGYAFWLNVLNTQTPGNYRSMVCAFLTSAEYQVRFGPTATRTNAECNGISAPTALDSGN